MRPSRLCVTVTAARTAELCRLRDEAFTNGADLVELRLDALANVNVSAVAEVLAGRPGPVIVTCRPTWEGGHFSGAEDVRRQVLEEALVRGAEYVDVEWNAGFDALVNSTHGKRVVISYHAFEGV